MHSEPLWDERSPTYRIDIWHRPTNADGSWALEAYVLEEAKDIREVLAWVDEHASEGQVVEVFVETENESVGSFQTPRKAALVRILGTSPNENESFFASFRKV
ncbi:hypothetical protein GCM10009673_27640 [Nesterenkonia sandarakina]